MALRGKKAARMRLLVLCLTLFFCRPAPAGECSAELLSLGTYIRFVHFNDEINLRLASDGGVSEIEFGNTSLEGEAESEPLHLYVDANASFDPQSHYLELIGRTNADRRAGEKFRIRATVEGRSFYRLSALNEVLVDAVLYSVWYQPIWKSIGRFERRPMDLHLRGFRGSPAREIYDLLDKQFPGRPTDDVIYRRLFTGLDPGPEPEAFVKFGTIRTYVELAHALRGLRALGLREDHPIFTVLNGARIR